ncbi:FtsX-like permease family protein [Candidatus Parcubacteria bacterium]|nr:MAG: FtsX-like permease family protein [Candidatus Parcubacteria bacterium]
MKLRHLISTAVRGLTTHKLRSLLTIIGIVIGIAAIILVMSIGQSAKELIVNQVRGLGSRTIIIEPGREPKGPADFVEIFTDSLKQRDVQALQKPANVQGVQTVTPLVAQIATVAYKNETKRAQLRGAAPPVAEILNISTIEGNFFSEEDIHNKARVAVLGYEVYRELFNGQRAVGAKIKIKDHTFRVVGVLAKKGKNIIPVDDMVIVPYTTAQQYLLGISHYHAILVQAASEELVPRVAQEIKLTLRELHHITDPDKDDFHVTTQEDAMNTIGNITAIFTALLASVAGISLVVGGIGIMNIMLVSVTERTKEIGLRKALGATRDDILAQFLLEAILLTGMGGIIGILLGSGLSLLAALILRKLLALGWAFSFSVTGALLGVGVATLVGIVFGLYPALQAAKKSPIEALRYE